MISLFAWLMISLVLGVNPINWLIQKSILSYMDPSFIHCPLMVMSFIF